MLGHIAVALLPVLRGRDELRPLVPKRGGGVELDESHGGRPIPVDTILPVLAPVTASPRTTPIACRTQKKKEKHTHRHGHAHTHTHGGEEIALRRIHTYHGNWYTTRKGI